MILCCGITVAHGELCTSAQVLSISVGVSSHSLPPNMTVNGVVCAITHNCPGIEPAFLRCGVDVYPIENNSASKGLVSLALSSLRPVLPGEERFGVLQWRKCLSCELEYADGSVIDVVPSNSSKFGPDNVDADNSSQLHHDASVAVDDWWSEHGGACVSLNTPSVNASVLMETVEMSLHKHVEMADLGFIGPIFTSILKPVLDPVTQMLAGPIAGAYCAVTLVLCRLMPVRVRAT